MKWMIASDIHGSLYYCRKMLELFEKEKAERLILLGDILYHGPRNDLPREYNPREVIRLLNQMPEKILCVRGNCDTEVDQMVLKFPILADYAVFVWGERTVYATHGHRWNPSCPPPMVKGDVLLNGHTHIPAWDVTEDFLYMNPGSVSIPKEDSGHTCMIVEADVCHLKDLEGNIIWKKEI